VFHPRKVEVYMTPMKGVGEKVVVTKDILFCQVSSLDGDIWGRLQPHHASHPPKPESLLVGSHPYVRPDINPTIRL